MDFQYMLEALPKLLKSLPVSLGITAVAVSSGLAVGGLFTLCKLSRHRWLARTATAVTTVIRGIPVIVLLFLAYFGLPELLGLLGLNITGWNKAAFAIIALATDVAATASEMFRSAYLSLERGQLDAAASIGMNRLQTIRRVIIPQALRVVIPNIGNLCIAQFQATSLVYTLGIIDVVGKLHILDQLAYGGKVFELYIMAALVYWAVCVVVAKGFQLLEGGLNRGIRSAQ